MLKSKISQLPRKIRDELCQRMEDGQMGPKILPWLNALPEVQELLAEKYDGVPISDQNLSNWRETGFSDWQDQQKELAFVHNATAFSKDVVKATGLQMTEGAAAIAAGTVLMRLEELRRKQLAGDDINNEELASAIDMLQGLRGQEIAREHVQVTRERNQLHREKGEREKDKLALEREKFEIAAAKAVLKHAQSKEVQAVIKGPGSNADKIAALRRKMFPQRPAEPATTPSNP